MPTGRAGHFLHQYASLLFLGSHGRNPVQSADRPVRRSIRCKRPPSLLQARPSPRKFPRGKRTFTIAACAGCFAEVLIEQMHESMPVAILSGPGIVDPIPRFCDAGIHSVVRIPFISPQSGNYELQIHLARPSSETVRITLAASRPAAASDRDVAAAYEAMARAEGLRRASASI